MKLLVGAAIGALVCGALGALSLARNWSYARKHHEIGNVAGYSIIGGAVAGALIAAFL